MRVFGIVGPGAEDVAARVTPHLDGRTATVEAVDAVDDVGAADSYQLADDGSWRAAGTERTFAALLDDITPRYDHAICLGVPDARIPTIAVGESTATDTRLTAASADEVAVDDVIDLLADVEPRVTLSSLVERLKSSPRADRAGAIATFTGRVRAKDADDDPRTTALEFEKYEGVAEERMATICRELEAREGVLDVLMHHRTGVIEDGEDIVFVVVLAGHREEGFRTVEDGINRLKDEVPLFKKEVTVEDTFWRHER